MEASDINKTKDLENVNQCLKQMCVDLSLECRAFKDVIDKNVKTSLKRELVKHLTTTFCLSIRQACRALNLSITLYHCTL